MGWKSILVTTGVTVGLFFVLGGIVWLVISFPEVAGFILVFCVLWLFVYQFVDAYL